MGKVKEFPEEQNVVEQKSWTQKISYYTNKRIVCQKLLWLLYLILIYYYSVIIYYSIYIHDGYTL